NNILMDKSTKGLKNGFSYQNNSRQYKQENGIDVKEYTVQIESPLQNRNTRKSYLLNAQAYLRRFHQALNSCQFVEKNKNIEGITQYSNSKTN
ncbi:38442_t:CDS:1, partial [Gigaspora margarita]